MKLFWQFRGEELQRAHTHLKRDKKKGLETTDNDYIVTYVFFLKVKKMVFLKLDLSTALD